MQYGYATADDSSELVGATTYLVVFHIAKLALRVRRASRGFTGLETGVKVRQPRGNGDIIFATY